MSIDVRPVTVADRSWVRSLMREHWGAPEVVSRGRIHLPEELPGFVARIESRATPLGSDRATTTAATPATSGAAGPDPAADDTRLAGLITYRIDVPECEIVTLNSLREGAGIGTALIQAVIAAAREAGCRRLWLITTNDNLHAIRFYQKRGFELVAVHRGAIEESRRLKPSIPLIGMGGIPIRDEVELEMPL